MKNIAIIVLVCIGLRAAAQQTVTIAGEAYSPNGQPKTVSVLPANKNPVGDEFIYLAHIPVKLNNTFYYKLPLSKPALLVIHYWGGESKLVYAIPGDSIHIKFVELVKPDTVKNMMMARMRKERSYYSGNDPARLGFFDMLGVKTGALDGQSFRISPDADNFLLIYKAKLASIRQQRLQILEDEDKLHHFSAAFKTVAYDEINGNYINGLMNIAFFGDFWDKLPPGYLAEVDKDIYNVTWDKFNGARAAPAGAYLNVMYYNRRVKGQSEEDKLASAVNNCMQYKDDSVRNFMLTEILSRNMEAHPANYDDLVEKYTETCTNQAYVNGFLAIYKPALVGKPFPDDVLSTALKTTDGKPVSLKDIMPDGKPVFIDFWASWCAPCKKEIPILMQLAEKYKGKIDFRFVSIDVKEKEADWLKALAGTNFTGAHYLVQDKALINYARIKSIPRYLVIDKNGHITTYRGPNLLEDQEGFENTLKEVAGN